MLWFSCADEQAPARPQWIVELSTNAVPPALGARVWVDVLDGAGAVVPERRRIIDAPAASDWPISFGIRPGLGPPPRLRVRFYRFDITGAFAEPDSTAIVDLTAALPALDEGPVRVQLGLALECFGVPPDLGHRLSCDPRTGMLAPEPTLSTMEVSLQVGSFRPARADACREAPPTGMTCVPGGVSILGPTKLDTSPHSDPAPTPPRLVELSSFALDTDEVTVGQVRALVAAGRVVLHDPLPDLPALCTSRERADSDAMNCISWRDARDVCAALGKRLPSEAEWEYAAGNLAEKSTYPWGDDDAICSYAWVARGRTFGRDGSCREGSRIGTMGPLPGGSPRDVTRLGILNMGGNLAEWTSDIARGYDSPCWQGTPLLIEPHCDVDVNQPFEAHRYRGGSWRAGLTATRVDVRAPGQGEPTDDLPSEGIGLRCALSSLQK